MMRRDGAEVKQRTDATAVRHAEANPRALVDR
jgi:hypothetical protein